MIQFYRHWEKWNMRNVNTGRGAKITRQGNRGRSMDGEILSVDSTARFLGVTPKTVYSHVYRRLIPFRKWGGRIVFLRRELQEYFQNLPGCKPEEAMKYEKLRTWE